MSLNFFDFEVFKYNWLVIVIDPINEKRHICYDKPNALKKFYDEHKNDIWIGYNSRNYDAYILKAILLGFDPYEVSQWITIKKRKGWEYSSLFNTIPLNTYDCMSKFYSLKQLEGFMGNDMKETGVSFNIDRPLTEDEMIETIKYCNHDVEQTMEVFIKNKADFDAHMAMLKTFDLPISDISKTQVQLSAKALGAVKKDWFDEWEYSLVNTLRIKKYKHVIDWFMNPANHDYSKSLTVEVCGVPHQFGWGGLHGAIGTISTNTKGTQIIKSTPIHRKGCIIHVDVTSYYPSMMIVYDFLSRNVKDKSVFKKVYDTRVALKKAGKKKEQAPYKIILNGTYGASKDPTNPLYDPRQANNVCVNGQLLLLDLLEHLEGHCEVIQSNTDGLIIQIEDTDEAFDKVDDICFEWEKRTGMKLGFDVITEIWQKDVNNYIFRFENGKFERKGAYVKELSDLDNDLPIVNTALVDYMTKKIPVEQTVMQCKDLKQFQKIVKIQGDYICGWHNGQKLMEKTFRVFASTNQNDSFIGKVKIKKDKEAVEKFANTPEHCFIYNDDVNGKKVPKNLDRQYYIEMATKRLEQFGM